MENINFLYEGENKFIIGNLKNNKIINKKFFYGNLEKLDFEDKSFIFLDDKKFSYFQKHIALTKNTKFTIKDIENEIKNIDFEKNVVIGYNISNIKINGEKSNYILGKKGNIEYVLGVYTLNPFYYNDVLKFFGKNMNISIYPNSLFLLKEISKQIENGNILYFGKENIKIVNIKNSFYFGIEKLDIGVNIFYNEIRGIYGKLINNLSTLSDFQKKVYIKKMKEFLTPIILFINSNLKGNKIFIIGDFANLPGFIDYIGKETKTEVVPVNIDNQHFSSIENANIHCIKKFF